MYKIILVFAFIWLGLGVYTFLGSRTTKSSIIEPTLIPTPTLMPNVNADKLFQLVNSWRIENDYQPYIKSDLACSVANQRLPEVQANFSHEGFYYERFCASCYLAENLVRGFPTEKEALNGWLSSPAHLKNLQSNYSHSCIKCDNNFCVHTFSYF